METSADCLGQRKVHLWRFRTETSDTFSLLQPHFAKSPLFHMEFGRQCWASTYNMSPFRVRLGRTQRLAVLRHVQDVGVEFRSHGGERTEGRMEDFYIKEKNRGKRREWSLVRWKLKEMRKERRRRKRRRGWRMGQRGSGTPRSCRSLRPRANSGKDGGMNYWLGEKRGEEELAALSAGS